MLSGVNPLISRGGRNLQSPGELTARKLPRLPNGVRFEERIFR